MPSIGYWNRIEAERSIPDTLGPLRAQIRDPFWMLLRQWQLGEFAGADSGSPAYATYQIGTVRATGWRANGQGTNDIGAAPLESRVEAEPLTPDVATRVELGQIAERLLRANQAGETIEAFRAAYPISIVAADPVDAAEVAFRRVCGGRAIDGVALQAAVLAAAPALPAQPPLTAPLQPPVAVALAAFTQWIAATLGTVGEVDPPAWQPEKLTYSAEVTAADAVLTTQPGSDGEFGWDTYDLKSDSRKITWKVQPKRSVSPAHVRFRGLASARFWDFEPSTTDLGALTVNRADTGRLAVMDIMLLHGNDWFTIPIDVAVGSLCQVRSLVIRDVFGVETTIEATDDDWTMFALSETGGAKASVPCLFVPPTAQISAMNGPVLEEVKFARDEMANMVWAVEEKTQNGIGNPWTGHERDVAHNRVQPAPPKVPVQGVPLRYAIESTVPEYWIPMLPVSIDPTIGTVALEESSMVRPGNPPTPILPAGRVLTPTTLAGVPYRIREEEIPRTAVWVRRTICLSRWIDGTTFLWGARRREPGKGDINSALRFDQANPNS